MYMNNYTLILQDPVKYIQIYYHSELTPYMQFSQVEK